MKQLKKQGRYIILKRRICAFKIRADFENKRKTDGIYFIRLMYDTKIVGALFTTILNGFI